jgi:hypothetical protein
VNFVDHAELKFITHQVIAQVLEQSAKGRNLLQAETGEGLFVLSAGLFLTQPVWDRLINLLMTNLASISPSGATFELVVADFRDRMNQLRSSEAGHLLVVSSDNSLKTSGVFLKSSVYRHRLRDFVIHGYRVIDREKQLIRVDPIFDQEGFDFVRPRGDLARVKTVHGDLLVTHHAFREFCQDLPKYFLTKKNSRRAPVPLGRKLGKMVSVLNRTKPAVRRNQTKQLLRHGFEPSTYYIADQWVFVVAKGRIKTCYYKEDTSFKQMYKILGQ